MISIAELYQIYSQHPQVFTDSRNIKKDGIYFALKGEHFDGNDFALSCINNGAAFAVVDNPHLAPHEKLIQVDDCLICLQQLAKYHRQQFNIPFIAITGSNGKTTTKELTAAVLQTQYKTSFTQGNLNNHIGIPLTILAIPKNIEIAIIEMGANHQKEIEGYCSIAQPNYGIITNCGKAHMEGFGGVLGIRKGKGELFDYLALNKGTIFINGQESYLLEMAANHIHKIIYNTKNSHYQLKVLSQDPFLKVAINMNEIEFDIQSQLVGEYNAANIMTAATIGNFFGISNQNIQSAIEHYCPNNHRSQLIEWHENIVILDAYNANPSSMELAIKHFSKQHYKDKILFLGAMKELGEYSRIEHQKLIDFINQFSWNLVCLVGNEFNGIEHSYHHFQHVEDLIKDLPNFNLKDKAILIKGSRSTHMELIIKN